MHHGLHCCCGDIDRWAECQKGRGNAWLEVLRPHVARSSPYLLHSALPKANERLTWGAGWDVWTKGSFSPCAHSSLASAKGCM
eukprot:scaffold11960_cov19-Tisochrysis_lutea.AAC.8